MDKWAHLGHMLGECWANSNTTYVHIPKNASSFIKGCVLAAGEWTHHRKLIQNNHYIVALRDPVERWISGMAQFQINSDQLSLPADHIFDTITFDDHTESQLYFLTGVNLSDATFFKVDYQLTNSLKKYFGNQVNVDGMPKFNSSIDDPLKLKLKAHLSNLIDNNPEYLLKLKEHFADDYKLIESVKFYD